MPVPTKSGQFRQYWSTIENSKVVGQQHNFAMCACMKLFALRRYYHTGFFFVRWDLIVIWSGSYVEKVYFCLEWTMKCFFFYRSFKKLKNSSSLTTVLSFFETSIKATTLCWFISEIYYFHIWHRSNKNKTRILWRSMIPLCNGIPEHFEITIFECAASGQKDLCEP